MTITQNGADYPDIPQSGEAWSNGMYEFTVSEEATDGEVIPFTIAWMSNESSGSTGFTEMIVAPTLEFAGVTVLDGERGDGDGIIDPGETVTLVVTIANNGNGLAHGVMGHLDTLQPEYITIDNGHVEFPDIAGGASGQSMAPHFIVTASPDTPDPTVITFNLNMTAEGYTNTNDFQQEVTASTFARRYFYNMDFCPGWAAEGQWEHGVPQGNEGDPSSGYTGENVFGYNLAGDYENSMSETYLTTDNFDCSNLASVEVRFMRWLGVESASYDHASFQISTDGETWTTLWDHTGSSFTDDDWVPQVFDVSMYADEHPEVYFRWVMGTTDSSVTYCGWNIDDFEIWGESAGPDNAFTYTYTNLHPDTCLHQPIHPHRCLPRKHPRLNQRIHPPHRPPHPLRSSATTTVIWITPAT